MLISLYLFVLTKQMICCSLTNDIIMCELNRWEIIISRERQKSLFTETETKIGRVSNKFQFQFVFGWMNIHARHVECTSTLHHRHHHPYNFCSFIIRPVWELRRNLPTSEWWKYHYNIQHNLECEKCVIVSNERHCSSKLYRQSDMCPSLWSTQLLLMSHKAFLHLTRWHLESPSCPQLLQQEWYDKIRQTTKCHESLSYGLCFKTWARRRGVYVRCIESETRLWLRMVEEGENLNFKFPL